MAAFPYKIHHNRHIGHNSPIVTYVPIVVKKLT